jgi:hypothetical protein
MAACYACKAVLNGSWNLTTDDPSYEKTGRYLGVNGYFCYSGRPNWVYCYCLDCYKKEILRIAKQYNAELEPQINHLQTQLTTSKQQITQLTSDITTLQNNKTQLTSEVSTLQNNKTQYTNELAALKQAHQLAIDAVTLTNEIATLQNRLHELKQQMEEIVDITGANQLRSVIEGLLKQKKKEHIVRFPFSFHFISILNL